MPDYDVVEGVTFRFTRDTNVLSITSPQTDGSTIAVVLGTRDTERLRDFLNTHLFKYKTKE